MHIDTTYKTKDLGLAAYLYMNKEVELTSIERIPGQRVCYFHFYPEDRAFDMATDYMEESAKPVQPRRYASALKYVKDSLYSKA